MKVNGKCKNAHAQGIFCFLTKPNTFRGSEYEPLLHDFASWINIKPCIKMDKPLWFPYLVKIFNEVHNSVVYKMTTFFMFYSYYSKKAVILLPAHSASFAHNFVSRMQIFLFQRIP